MAIESTYDSESDSAPFPVAIAALIAFAKAAYLGFIGVIGVLAADTVDDNFAGVVFVFALVYAVAAWLVLRGRRGGRAILGVLSLVTVVVGVVYAFTGPRSGIIPSLVAAGIAFAIIALLYLPKQSKTYFAAHG